MSGLGRTRRSHHLLPAPSAAGSSAGIVFLKGQFWGFSPHRGDMFQGLHENINDISDIYHHDIFMIFSSENIMIYIIEDINSFSLRFFIICLLS